MVPATRRVAGWWLIATLVSVFPANVWMAQHRDRYPVTPQHFASSASTSSE